jgi:two-component system, NtrC family, sensor kinase
MNLTTIVQNIPLSVTDIFTLVPIIILVGILFYLSNKEIKKSLEQSIEVQEILSKKLEESQIMRLDELARAAEFGKAAQGIFHDLMSPLTSLILHTEKLRDDTSAKESIKKASEASKRMAIYIKDIRATLSREETERLCDIRVELDHILHLFVFAAREKNIEFKTEGSGMIYGSPTKLRQLFSNLISNALDSFDYIQRKDKIIEIKIAERSIQIKDNGCGIKKDDLDKIFKPFFTTKSIDKGTGIGLSTVKEIVERHFRGSITVRSTEGVDTTFSISFPQDNTNPVASHPLR